MRTKWKGKENNKDKDKVMTTHYSKVGLRKSTDTKVEERLTLDENTKIYGHKSIGKSHPKWEKALLARGEEIIYIN